VHAASASPPKSPRVASVDVLRGLVIVVMALDHTRDFFHALAPDPTDIPNTSVALFFTRWITHFCAPVFMATAGVAAYLSLSRGKTRRELSWFLVTRGLWLAVLEVTFVRSFGWFFNFDYHQMQFLVIWALGWSMVILAGLIWLPGRALAILSIAAIAGHNLLDGVEVNGAWSWLATIVFSPGPLSPAPGYTIGVGYVLLPWAFVMSLGYCCGPILQWTPERRQRALVWTGVLAVAAFVLIRGVNGYGDPDPWTHQRNATFTVLSFLNCEKYPPSLDYLLMTLGPGCLALAAFERWRGNLAGIFEVYGRVPLFFYLLHLPLIHAAAVLFAYARYRHAEFLFESAGLGPSTPPDYGYSLWVVYFVWLAIVAALYPLCRWFGEYKRTHRAAWVSYL
jgi:uncharacterized membrane protein